MKLEKYISDLLYRYDLVIIPDFGGIIGRKKGARLDRGTFIFSPPHKELSFNIQLQDNDGLLANYVAVAENISYEKALNAIQAQVLQWKKTLAENKRLKLPQIGIFNLVADDKIIFLPLTTQNYLASAYGLTSFVFKPVAKEEVSSFKEIPVVTATERLKPHKGRKHQKINSSRKTNNNKLWQYAAAVVVGLGIFTAGMGLVKNNEQANEPEFQKATFVLPENFPVIHINHTEKISPAKKDKPEITEKKYFIIAGAFRNKDNAGKKVSDLQKQGYDAKIIGQNKYGLWMVSLSGYADNEEAHRDLVSLKQSYPGVWVYQQK